MEAHPTFIDLRVTEFIYLKVNLYRDGTQFKVIALQLANSSSASVVPGQVFNDRAEQQNHYMKPHNTSKSIDAIKWKVMNAVATRR